MVIINLESQWTKNAAVICRHMLHAKTPSISDKTDQTHEDKQLINSENWVFYGSVLPKFQPLSLVHIQGQKL